MEMEIVKVGGDIVVLCCVAVCAAAAGCGRLRVLEARGTAEFYRRPVRRLQAEGVCTGALP